MNPRDFLDLAHLLASGTAKPANLRTATSRAYYSAHHVGAEVLRSMGLKISTGGTGHQDVWRRLQNSGYDDLKIAGSQLADLHSSRLRADYRLKDERAENQANVRAHIQQSEKIVEAIERSCSGANRQAILQAIKSWEAAIGQ